MHLPIDPNTEAARTLCEPAGFNVYENNIDRLHILTVEVEARLWKIKEIIESDDCEDHDYSDYTKSIRTVMEDMP